MFGGKYGKKNSSKTQTVFRLNEEVDNILRTKKKPRVVFGR